MSLFKKAGFYCPEIKPVHLYFKDWYQGVYLEIEEIDELFFERRALPVSSLYICHPFVKFSLHNGYTPENTFEKDLPQSDLNYSDLMKLFIIVDRGITVNDTAELNTILDVKNSLDYYTISVLINHSDGINNNLTLYFNPIIKKFQFIPWDLVNTLVGENNLSNPADYGHVNNLFDQMIKIEAWNNYCINRAKELFDFDELNTLLDKYSQEVKISQINDPAIPISETQFDESIARLRLYYENLNLLLLKDSISFN
jgi:spore coat protein H